MKRIKVFRAQLFLVVLLILVLLGSTIFAAQGAPPSQDATPETMTLPPDSAASAPHAGEPDPSTAVLVEESYQRGEIDYDTAVLYNVYSLFDPQMLPSEYQSDTPGRGATLFLLEINWNWDNLSPEVKSELISYPVGLLARPSSILARPTLSGPELTYDTSHFQFHYTKSGEDAVDPADANSNGVPDYIETMGMEFENVWDTELDAMGWLQPPSDQTADGDPDFDVYVEDMPYYGYASAEAFADQGTQPGDNENSPSVTELNAVSAYMALDNDYAGFPNTPTYNIQVTAAHEFNHAIQFGYDVFEEPWLFEATASWIEDEVYDGVNDNLQYLDSYLSYPDACMPSEGSGLHWYGDWIFIRHLAEHQGGQATIRNVWENSVNYDGSTGFFSFNALSDALSGAGTSLNAAFEEFTAANYAMSTCPANSPYCYEEAASYPSVYVEGSINFSGVEDNYTPEDGIGNYAADYITITTSIDTVEVSVTGTGPSTNYAAQIVGMQGNSATVIPFNMNGTSGSVTVNDATLYDSLTLVVMNEFAPAGEASCNSSGYTVTTKTGTGDEPSMVFLPVVLNNYDASELLRNGNFDTGDFSPWQVYGSPVLDDQEYHSASYSARLGGANAAVDFVVQEVTVPANATEVTLDFWYRVSGDDPDPDEVLCYEIVDVEIENVFAGECPALSELAQNQWLNDRQLVISGDDLTPLLGQPRLVAFDVFTNGTNPGTAWVDNVTFKVTGTNP